MSALVSSLVPLKRSDWLKRAAATRSRSALEGWVCCSLLSFS
jgi:hypothetical protein